MGSKSNSSSSTTNNTTTNQFANYGDGVQVNNDGGQVEVNYLSKDVAIASIQEAGMFAETAAGMNLDMQRSNNNLVSDVLSLTQSQASKSDGMARNVIYVSVAVLAAVMLKKAK